MMTENYPPNRKSSQASYWSIVLRVEGIPSRCQKPNSFNISSAESINERIGTVRLYVNVVQCMYCILTKPEWRNSIAIILIAKIIQLKLLPRMNIITIFYVFHQRIECSMLFCCMRWSLWGMNKTKYRKKKEQKSLYLFHSTKSHTNQFFIWWIRKEEKVGWGMAKKKSLKFNEKTSSFIIKTFRQLPDVGRGLFRIGTGICCAGGQCGWCLATVYLHDAVRAWVFVCYEMKFCFGHK